MDRAYRDLRDRHKHLAFVIRVRYLVAPGDAQAQVILWNKRTGRGKSAYHQTLAEAHAWIDARVL